MIKIGKKVYQPEKSYFICNTPYGTLHKKKTRVQEFFLYNKNGKTPEESIRSLSYPEAAKLCRTYGSRDDHIKWFTVRDKSTNPKNGGKTPYYLDERHRMMVVRNAMHLRMNATQFIKYLIERYDKNKGYDT